VKIESPDHPTPFKLDASWGSSESGGGGSKSVIHKRKRKETGANILLAGLGKICVVMRSAGEGVEQEARESEKKKGPVQSNSQSGTNQGWLLGFQ